MELYDYIQQSIQPPLENSLGRVYQDQYPELTNDSRLWLELFMITDSPDHRLSDQLMIIRATGAILVPDQQWGYVIQPVIDSTGQKGWQSQQQYEQERQYLVPYTQTLITALMDLRRGYEQKLIV
ncbi:hypothetical protein Ga0466249_005048 [Sporomusaceae bacterium BoRhaA]|uniref:hypothetical protein n=1 Tax=Pelorhabdus rhamnosifermentans TaxID=2772457 RepID=UPI001C062DFD|nr:hypothetical protein [Pelorhabdus rhamnosifermentans]MBU2703898.1 hypothetical protein [Pelorhabdus rhamnosifermentans]